MVGKKQFTFIFEDLTEPCIKAAHEICQRNFTSLLRGRSWHALMSLSFFIAVGFVYLLGVACLTSLSFNLTWSAYLLLMIAALASQILYVVINTHESILNEPDLTIERFRHYWLMHPESRRFVIARCKETGDVVGTIAVRRETANDTTSELLRLRVDDRFQGYGLGKRLSLYCMDIAREWGCRDICLYTSDYFPFGVKLYKELGFQFDKEMTYFKFYGVLPSTFVRYSNRLVQEEAERKL